MRSYNSNDFWIAPGSSQDFVEKQLRGRSLKTKKRDWEVSCRIFAKKIVVMIQIISSVARLLETRCIFQLEFPGCVSSKLECKESNFIFSLHWTRLILLLSIVSLMTNYFSNHVFLSASLYHFLGHSTLVRHSYTTTKKNRETNKQRITITRYTNNYPQKLRKKVEPWKC